MKLTHTSKWVASTLLAASLAGSAIASPVSSANPEPGPVACNLENGLPASVTGAYDVANACLTSAPEGVSVRTDLLADLKALSQRHRARFGLDDLSGRAALDAAATVHAIDMAARGYAAHEDLEGRGHLYRMRLLDRTSLIASTGANIVVVPADGADAAEIFRTIASDEINAENMVRDGFTDFGVGVAEANGMLYVVQVFARVDGELSQGLPLTLNGQTRLDLNLVADTLAFEDWRLTGLSGSSIAYGINPVIAERDATEAAFLEVSVTNGLDTYVLKGPATGE